MGCAIPSDWRTAAKLTLITCPCNRRLGARLDAILVTFIVITTFVTVAMRHSVNPGEVALGLVYTLQVCIPLPFAHAQSALLVLSRVCVFPSVLTCLLLVLCRPRSFWGADNWPTATGAISMGHPPERRGGKYDDKL